MGNSTPQPDISPTSTGHLNDINGYLADINENLADINENLIDLNEYLAASADISTS